MNESPAESSKLRVLVIDDDADGASMLCTLLQMSECDTAVANTGADGLVAESSFHPHLAFIDLEMPGMDGREVARRLKVDGRATARLICLTGHRDPGDLKACLDAGFDQLIAKPLMPGALAAVLESARVGLVES